MRRIRKGSSPRTFENWKNNFQRLHGRRPIYDDFVSVVPEYIRLKKALLEEQGYICCYCEKAIGRTSDYDCDIEHFMPRHPDKRALNVQECAVCENAQLEYNNMFVSCKGEYAYSEDHCNHKKDNWFDFQKCISPASENNKDLFEFRLTGDIVSKNEKAEEMKKQLNLNSYVLKEQRKAAYQTIYDVEFPEGSEELLNDEEYILDTIELYNSRDTQGKYEPFCSMITYCMEHYVLNLL